MDNLDNVKNNEEIVALFFIARSLLYQNGIGNVDQEIKESFSKIAHDNLEKNIQSQNLDESVIQTNIDITKEFLIKQKKFLLKYYAKIIKREAEEQTPKALNPNAEAFFLG